MLPFDNTIDVMDLQGKYLREVLEVSVSEYNPDDPHGKFLQMSGKLLHHFFISQYILTLWIFSKP